MRGAMTVWMTVLGGGYRYWARACRCWGVALSACPCSGRLWCLCPWSERAAHLIRVRLLDSTGICDRDFA